jgi:uncharacterized cupredoxin-like copper-binding protein
LVKFEADGVMPSANNVEDNEEVDHSIFEIPAEDEEQMKAAMASMSGMHMPGMKMDGMKMDGMKMPTMDMPGMKMPAMHDMKMDGMKMPTMDMPGMKMPAMHDMKMDGMKMPAMDMPGMKMPAMHDMKMDGMKMPTMKMDKHGSEGGHSGESEGLKISDKGSFDREINLTMSEFKFSDMNIDVKTGERIRFTVKNDGQIPHEFMFMTMSEMSAVNYRIERADWSLLEHKALFEKALTLPGGEFSFVVHITKPGSWMFMCMLPYHMQMGMMGEMATEGMSMNMEM